jgi:hypothetical protein
MRRQRFITFVLLLISTPCWCAMNPENKAVNTSSEMHNSSALGLRMIMLDPARQNENFDYYRRVIAFCHNWGINAILLHLTDDQTACLYSADYPELMHPHAWREKDVRDLVKFAHEHDVQLIPEIESFGHSRMFERRADYRDYLHETHDSENKDDWYSTNKPGYTNVLCPASDKAYEYLDTMYSLAANWFDSPVIHIGCDEVDMTSCSKCEAKYPGISRTEWFRNHLERCRALVEKHGKRAAIWGDMLLKDKSILNGINPATFIIYDWQYHENVTGETLDFFGGKGFEVVACPSLMCYPHIILPAVASYRNVQRFTTEARKAGVSGVNTTFWIPTRYLSDAIWPAIAIAGTEARDGDEWSEDSFFDQFAMDFFGLKDGSAFGRIWNELAESQLTMPQFNAACWIDDKSLSSAQTLLREHHDQLRQKQEKTAECLQKLETMREKVTTNTIAFDAIVHSAEILQYSLEHLFAAEKIHSGHGKDLLPHLVAGCEKNTEYIEADWDRNRYADDPNKNGIYLPAQHLLARFRQMKQFHEQLLQYDRTPAGRHSSPTRNL